MKLLKVAGATSEIWQVFIQDSSSTTGAGLAGLAFNSASLTAYYHRDTDTTATAITLATMTVGTFTSSGFKEIDATNMPGWYQFCPPNAAIAAGAKSCAFHLKGATNMAPLPIECQLQTGVPIDTAAGAANGLLIAGSNAATTFAGLTTGALACTTITASGAVAFQSTFAVTGTFSYGASSDFSTTQKTSLTTAANAVVLDSANFSAAAENAFADALLDRVDAIETGITLRLNERYLGAANAGVLSGAATTQVTILGVGVGTTRIVAQVDSDGNRSSIVLS